VTARLTAVRERLWRIRAAYGLRRPQDLLVGPARRLALTRGRLAAEMGRALGRRADAWRGAARQLAALSPRGVLARGYALARLPDGRLARTWRQTPPGTRLTLEFAEGSARARVESAGAGPAVHAPADGGGDDP
jgi:exodeoxyribonuclease VII large subunit